MKNFTIFILFYVFAFWNNYAQEKTGFKVCLLYTSDAADERSSVDLGGRRIIKKKTYGTHRCLRALSYYISRPLYTHDKVRLYPVHTINTLHNEI